MSFPKLPHRDLAYERPCINLHIAHLPRQPACSGRKAAEHYRLGSRELITAEVHRGLEQGFNIMCELKHNHHRTLQLKYQSILAFPSGHLKNEQTNKLYHETDIYLLNIQFQVLERHEPN